MKAEIIKEINELTNDQLQIIKNCINRIKLKNTTNDDVPFVPGEIIEYSEVYAEVITNNGAKGYVKIIELNDDYDYGAKFWEWDCGGTKCKRVINEE